MTNRNRSLIADYIFTSKSFRRTVNLSSDIIYSTKSIRRALNLSVDVIYDIKPIRTVQVIREIIYTAGEFIGTPADVNQFNSAVVQSDNFPTLGDTISPMDNASTVSAVITADDFIFPWSFSSVFSNAMLVAIQNTDVTISIERVPQVISSVAVGSREIPLHEMWSKTAVGQALQLVCLSLDDPYVPTSGTYVKNALTQVLIQSGYTWPSIPAMVSELMMLVALKRPLEYLPKSDISAWTVSNLVATSRTDALPQSDTNTNAVTTLVASTSEPDIRVGMEHSAGSFLQVVMTSVPPVLQGIQFTAQTVVTAAVATEYEWDEGYGHTGGLLSQVAQMSVYKPTTDYMLNGVAFQVMNLIPQLAIYPAVSQWGYQDTKHLSMEVAMQPPARFYPPLGEVEEGGKNAMVPSFSIQTALQTRDPLPISVISVPQLSTLSAGRSTYPTIVEYLRTGAFVSGLIEQVMVEREYPSPYEPTSSITTESIAQQLAEVVDYPPLNDGQSPASVFQIAESFLYEEAYLDPNTIQSFQFVHSLTQNILSRTNYPIPNTLNSLALVDYVSMDVARTAVFPDKDTVYASASVRQVISTVARPSEFAPKDDPQSAIRAGSIYQTVARIDKSLHVMPPPKRRHRVRVVCKVVYVNKRQ